MHHILAPLAGGALIGFASVLMLLFNGKILGISGIVGGIFQKDSSRDAWRTFFLFGLLIGGLLSLSLLPGAFNNSLSRSNASLIVAGLLVGYGTRLGGGCTSGHGICGISRLSPRSLLATLLFMSFGALTVFLINHVLGGRI